MTLEDDVTLLDPFTHTEQDKNKIAIFDFIRENSTIEREKVRIEETYCTLVTVGGKLLEKKAFKKVLKKIDEIRRIFRIKIIYNYIFPETFPCMVKKLSTMEILSNLEVVA